MAELNIDTGLVTFNPNGACEVSFNPTDASFIRNLYEVFNSLDKKQDEYRAEIEKIGDKAKIFDVANARDAEMRSMIDGIFGKPVCEAVFGKMNVYALAGGLPVWCNLMFAIMDEIDTSFTREQKLTNPRISKYAAKYHK